MKLLTLKIEKTKSTDEGSEKKQKQPALKTGYFCLDVLIIYQSFL